jgi:hypothetical protein
MKSTRRMLGIILVVLVLTVGWVGAAEEQPLRNADIVKLTKLAMGDEVIITKIKTAKEVKFDTSTDDLVKLKESGISGPVIAAMMERSASGAVSGTSPATGSVALKVALAAKEGTFDIKPIAGDLQTVFAFIGLRRFIQFSGNTSSRRIKDHFPTLLLNIDRDPQKIWWLVKLKPWDDKGRILDLPSPGMFGGAMSSGPDDSCDVPFTAIEEKPGMWRITPKSELMPGEYGMFRWEGDTSLTQASSRLYDFGVDK